MSLRLNYYAAAPEGAAALRGVNEAILKAGFDKKLMDLVFLRVSQINGCAYCVDMHSRDLRKENETNERLDGLAAWRESPYFTDAEKAALGWAESLTLITQTRAPDADFELVRKHYGDADLANLTYLIALMNAWNRIAVGFRQGPAKKA